MKITNHKKTKTMKNFIFISIALIFGFSACGQKLKKEDIPAVITAKFKSLYPNVEDVKWGKEDVNYEAEFDLNKVETSVVFDANGNALETETEISVNDLPANAKTYISTNMPSEKIKEASKITDVKGIITFEAEVKGVDYIFNKDGGFIKKAEE
jgi:hypothetical protein